MSTSKHIQIFRAGKHTAMSGAVLSFSDADLMATAAAYDSSRHEAPLVIGHPKTDDPAFGWVGKVTFAEGALEIEPVQVNPEFAEMVKNGAFKKISASFYSPTAPGNPSPGVYSLKHVGFLGAAAPAVKGLRQPEFAADQEGVIEFADYDDVVNAGLWRRLRDWMIGEKGLAVADNIIPDYQVSTLETMAQQEDDDSDSSGTPIPAFADQTKIKGDDMSVEDRARLAVLEEENRILKADQLAFCEAEKTKAATDRHDYHLAFAEGLVKAGTLLPAQKEVAVATLDFMAGQEQVVEFGEGDAKKPLTDAFKGLLQTMPKVVEFSELAGGKGATGAIDVDDSAALAAKALEFQEAEAGFGRTINIAQAVQHISNLNGEKQS